MKNTLFSLLLTLMLPLSSVGMENLQKDSLTVLDYPESMETLLNQFKGHVVYIDVLASWCKPCIREFDYTKKMDDYFKENKIIKLYITIDQAKDNEKCAQLLKEKSMTGYLVHYSPNSGIFSQFSKDVDSVFLTDKNGNLSPRIPRYGIVDRHGKLVINDAYRPSSPEKLSKQLKDFL